MTLKFYQGPIYTGAIEDCNSSEANQRKQATIRSANAYLDLAHNYGFQFGHAFCGVRLSNTLKDTVTIHLYQQRTGKPRILIRG